MPDQGKQARQQALAEKRAAALRENLKRRKQQRKERDAPEDNKRKEA
jgi:hypothetical protein